MIKSLRTSRFAAALAATCLLGLTACGSVSSSSDAFSVNGTGYAEEDFNKLSDVLISAGQFTAINGKIKAEDAIVVLRTLIRYEAFLQFIEEKNVKILESDKAEVLKNANADEKFPTYPKELQDVLVNFNIADVTLRKMTPPAIDKIEKLYSDSPASAGVLCLSHILVKTEAEAKTVLADLKSGTKFADVAAKKSIEPGADKSGGALKNGDSDCQTLVKLQSSFDPDFMRGAVDAKPGVPTGPIKSAFGYHVILSHPYEKVKTSVLAIVKDDPGNNLLAGYLSSADITVNSVYGTWDGALGTIK